MPMLHAGWCVDKGRRSLAFKKLTCEASLGKVCGGESAGCSVPLEVDSLKSIPVAIPSHIRRAFEPVWTVLLLASMLATTRTVVVMPDGWIDGKVKHESLMDEPRSE